MAFTSKTPNPIDIPDYLEQKQLNEAQILTNFSLANSRYKPYVTTPSRKQAVKNVKLERIVPFVKSTASSSLEDLIRVTDNRSTMYASAYKSNHPQQIMQQFDRASIAPSRGTLTRKGSFAKNLSVTQTKFKLLSPKSELDLPKPKGSISSLKQLLDPIALMQSKAINYIEYDTELDRRLNLAIPVLAYTKIQSTSGEQWVQCEVLNKMQENFLIYIPTLKINKEVTRLNLMLLDENAEDHKSRIEQAKQNRQVQKQNSKFVKSVQYLIFTQNITVPRSVLDNVSRLVFEQPSMQEQKNKYLKTVLRETSNNYQQLIAEIRVKSEEIYQLEVQRQTYPIKLDIDFFDKNKKLLEIKYNRVGIIPILKTQDQVLIIDQTRDMMLYASYSQKFRLFNDLKTLFSTQLTLGGSQLLQVYKAEFMFNVNQLKLKILLIEESIEKLRQHIQSVISFHNSQSIQIDPPDYREQLKYFQEITQKKFTQIISSQLTISIEQSFNELISILSGYFNDYRQNLLIVDVKEFKNIPSYINLDSKIMLKNYLQLISDTLSGASKNYFSQIKRENGLKPLFGLTLKIQNTKKKIKNLNLIKYVLGQREKVYNPSKNLDKIYKDILRDNWDECTLFGNHTYSQDEYLNDVNKFYPLCLSRRFGWFSFRRLKVICHPSLYEYEGCFKEAINFTLQQILDQLAIGQYITKKTLYVQSTQRFSKLFNDFLDQQLYQQYQIILPLIVLVNNFNFYLQEIPFIAQVLKIYEQNRNIILFDQERANLQQDLEFVSNKLPDLVEVGLFAINLMSFKTTIKGSIQTAISSMDTAMIQFLERVLKENESTSQKIANLLNEHHNYDVLKYISQISYVNSRELTQAIEQIKNNQHAAEMTLKTIDRYQVSISDEILDRYLNQLGLVFFLEIEKSNARSNLDSYREQFNQMVEKEATKLVDSYSQLQDKILAFKLRRKSNQNLTLAKDLDHKIYDLVQIAKEINRQQKFLKFPVTNFDSYDLEYHDFQKYCELWDLAVKIQFKVEIWERSSFLEVDVREIMEISRDYTLELTLLLAQFYDENIVSSLNQLRVEITKYEPYFQTMIILQDLQVRPRRFETVMQGLFQDDKLDVRTITINGLMEIEVNKQQERIISNQIKFLRDLQIQQRVLEYDNHFKDIQIKSFTYDLEGVSFPIVTNTTSILMTLQELELDIAQFLRNNPQLAQNVRDKCHFYQLTCQHSRPFLKKIFYIQDIVMQLAPFIRYMQYVWPEYDQLKDDHVKRIDNVKRLGIQYFCQIFDKGEVPIEKNFDREEISLFRQRLHNMEETARILQKKFSDELDEFRNKNSRLSYLTNIEICQLFYDLHNPLSFENILLKLFPNIKKFYLTNNVSNLKLIKYISEYDEELKIDRKIELTWKNADKDDICVLFDTIEQTYIKTLKENIYGYLPVISECHYSLVNIYKVVQMNSLMFQSLYLLLQLQFYHDLTMILYLQEDQPENNLNQMKKLLIEEGEKFMQTQHHKSRKIMAKKQFEMYNQLLLLFYHFTSVIDFFLAQNESKDQYIQKLQLNSFEYLALPKFSLEASKISDDMIKSSLQGYAQLKQENINNQSLTSHLLGKNPQICLMSFNNKQYYSFELQGSMDLILITPQMQKTFFMMLGLLRDLGGVFLQGLSKKTTLNQFTTILAKPKMLVRDFAQTNHMIGCLLQRGAWGICETYIQHLGPLLLEIYNQLHAQKDKVRIDGQIFHVNLNFRILGVIPQKIDRIQIEAYKSIQLYHQDDELLYKTFGRLLGIGQALVDKLDLFWENVRSVFRVYEGVSNLPSIFLIMKFALQEYRNQKNLDQTQLTTFVLQFFEMIGDRMSIKLKSLLVHLIDEEFNQEKKTKNADRNQLLDSYSLYAKEYFGIEPNPRLLEQLCAFMDHFQQNGSIVLVGKNPRKIVDTAAFVYGKIKNIEFQLIYFPLYTISKEILLGEFDGKTWQPGLLKMASNFWVANEDDISSNYYMNRILPQQLITKNAKSKKKQPLSPSDWFVFDQPWDYEPFSKRLVALGTSELFKIVNPSVILVENLHNVNPKPLDNYIICEEIMEQDELYLQAVMKLGRKNQFFKRIEQKLKELYFFLCHDIMNRQQVANLIKLMKVNLNEIRKSHIANGLLTQSEYSQEERRLNFDPQQLFRQSSPQKSTEKVVEAIFMICIIYAMKPYVDEDQFKQLSFKIISNINQYTEHQDLGHSFADGLLEKLKETSLNLFETYYDIYSQTWKGFPELVNNASQLQIIQKRYDSNILSAYETVRLNPGSAKILQIQGQLQLETQYFTLNTIQGQNLSFDHYLCMLMAMSGQKILIQDYSINQSSIIFSKILEMNRANQIVKMDTDRTLEKFSSKILEKADFQKQYSSGLENKNLKVNFIIEDLNIDHQPTQFLRSLLNYNAVQSGYQTLRCENYRFLCTSKSDIIPEFLQEKCFFQKLSKESPMLLYSIFKTENNPLQCMILASLKVEIGEKIPSFIQFIPKADEFIRFFKSIYSTKSSSHEDFKEIYKACQNYKNQVGLIQQFYSKVPDYKNFHIMNDRGMIKLFQNYGQELQQWELQGPSRREVNQSICKLICASLYASDLEYEELEKIYKKTKAENKINVDQIWKYLPKDDPSVLEQSTDKLARLHEIFKIVERYAPYIYLKATMSPASINSALRIYSEIYGWQSMFLDLQKFHPDQFSLKLNQFVSSDRSKTKFLLLRIQYDQQDHFQILSDLIDDIKTTSADQISQKEITQLRFKVILVYSKKPKIKNFEHTFSVSEDLPSRPTIYELKYSKHFNRQTPEFEKLIEKNDRQQVYRMLYELESYFDEKEKELVQAGTFAKCLTQINEKINQFTVYKEQLSLELTQSNQELNQHSIELSNYQQKLESTLLELQTKQEELDDLLKQSENCKSKNKNIQLTFQDRYILIVEDLVEADLSNLGCLTDESLNCYLYHSFFLYLAGERKFERIRSDDHFFQLRQSRQQFFLSFMKDKNVKQKLQQLLKVNFYNLFKDARDQLQINDNYGSLDEYLFTSDASRCIKNLVDLYYRMSDELRLVDEQQQDLQKSIQVTKDLIKKYQNDVATLKQQTNIFERNNKRLSDNTENIMNSIQRAGLSIEQLIKFQDAFSKDIKYSYIANKYYYDIENRTSCLFVIALYIVLQSIDSKHKIKIENATEQLALIPWTLQQENLYYRIYQHIDQKDAQAVDKLCLVNFFLQAKTPFMMIYDDSDLVLRMMNMEKYNFEVQYQPKRLHKDFVGNMIVAVDPSNEFLDEAAEYLFHFIEEKCKSYQMEIQYSNKQNSKLSQTPIQGFYLVIIFSQKPPKAPLEFIQINLIDTYQPSSHQRLLDIFVHSFKKNELESLIQQQKSFTGAVNSKQESVLNNLLYQLNNCNPSDAQSSNFLSKFRFELFESRFKDICNEIYQQRQEIKNEIRQCQIYRALKKDQEMMISEPDEEEEEDDEEDQDESERTLQDEETVQTSAGQSQSLQPFLRGERIQYQRFMKLSYLKDRYFYPIKGLQTSAMVFLDITGFLIFMRKLLIKISKLSPNYSVGEQNYWISVRETIAKTQELGAKQINSFKNFTSTFAQFWFMQIICQFSKEHQTVIYIAIAFKYLKLLGQLNIFKRDYFLQGYVNTDVDLFDYKEKFAIEKLVLQKENLRIDKKQIYNKEANLLKRHIRVFDDGVISEERGEFSDREFSGEMKSNRQSCIVTIPLNFLLQQTRRQTQEIPKNFKSKLAKQDIMSLPNIQDDCISPLKNEKQNQQSRLSMVRDSILLREFNDAEFFAPKDKNKKIITISQKNQLELLKTQISFIYSKWQTTLYYKNLIKQTFSGANENRVVDWRQRNSLNSQVEPKPEDYKMEFLPNNISQAMNKLQYLCTDGRLNNILDRFLEGMEREAWNHFCFTPVNIMHEQMRDLQIPLPPSVDAQSLPIIDMLLIFKLIKPSGLSATVESVLGQQILSDLYYPGQTNFKFLSTAKRNIILIFHSEPIVNTLKQYFHKKQFQILSPESPNLILDLQQAVALDKWVILTGPPQRASTYQSLIREIQNYQQGNKLWILININQSQSSPFLRPLMDISLRLWIDKEKSQKEQIQKKFLREILKISQKGESKSKKQFEQEKYDLNTYVNFKSKQKSEQYRKSPYEFIDKFTISIRKELKYNIMFVTSLISVMNRYPQSVCGSDIQSLFKQVLKCIHNYGVHPYVIVYKFLTYIHDTSYDNYELRSFIFQILKKMIFKCEMQQIQLEGESEFSSYQFKMLKLFQEDDVIDHMDQFCKQITESGMIDFAGQSIFQENYQNFIDSQVLMRNLNIIRNEKLKKPKMTVKQYFDKDLKKQKDKCNSLLKVQKDQKNVLNEHLWLHPDDASKYKKGRTKLNINLNKIVRSKVLSDIKEKHQKEKMSILDRMTDENHHSYGFVDEHIHHYMNDLVAQIPYLQFKKKDFNLRQFIRQRQIADHIEDIDQLDFDKDFEDDILMINRRFKHIVESEKSKELTFDLQLNDPYHFLLTYLILQKYETQIPIRKMRIICSRVSSQITKEDIVITGLFIVNAHLNVQNLMLEDGNPYIEKLAFPPLKLTICEHEGDYKLPTINMELEDKFYNLTQEHHEQMLRYQPFKEVSFIQYLRHSPENIRSYVKEDKTIHFVKIPIRCKSFTNLDGYFYFKSMLPQSHWTTKNAYVSN